MEYRRFGKTDYPVSVFTLGGMRFLKGNQLPYHHLPDDSLENTTEVIKTALDAGINLIETARGYGKSERLIGVALRRLDYPRKSYRIMTKAPAVAQASEMRHWIDEALENLQVEKLDFFAFHGINSAYSLDAVIKEGGSLAGVEQARKEGLIGSVGFSSHAPLPILLQTLDTRVFDFANIHYYFFRQTNQEAINRASDLDMGTFIISPNDQGGRLYTPPKILTQRSKPLPPAVFNECWLLEHPHIHTMSLGINHPEQMALHQQSLALRTPPGKEIVQTISHRLQTINQTSKLHQCGICTQCLPCPEDINIPEMLRLLKLSQLFDMTAYGQFRYQNMRPGDTWAPGAAGAACTQCGDCLPRCPEGLNIPRLLITSHKRLITWKKIFSTGVKFIQTLPFLRQLKKLFGS